MEKELDLYATWHLLIKRWKLLLVMPLLAALVSFLISYLLVTPQYKASTTLMVTRPEDKTQILFQDIQVTRQLVATYREIVHSRRVLDMTIASQSLPFTTEELRDKVEVESVRDTEIIYISVTDPDPLQGRDIANELARSFINQIEEIMLVENVRVVDVAVVPDKPVSPQIPLITAVALSVGLMAAFGLVFLLEYLDQTIKDPNEAQRLLDLPIIGVIPQTAEGQLFTLSNPRSPAAEAFRTLRTNIQYTGVDRPLRRILVAGANPACGKSTLSANLAVAIAQTGSKVLLVDTDLRKPTQHKIFQVESEPGLSDLVFKSDLTLDAVTRTTEFENLALLTCGPLPPYPAELIGSEKMKELVALFSEQFNYVIFDSPPIIAVTDAALLSQLVDGTIMVLDFGRVRRDEALGAYEQMKKVQAYMIGSVLNGIPTGKGYYYNGYSYYYGREASKERGKKKDHLASANVVDKPGIVNERGE